MRISKIEGNMEYAKAASKRSTCLKTRVGAAIFDESNTIVSTGYNGAPRGVTDCLERGECERMKRGVKSGTHYSLCNSVHGEANALLQAGKNAIGGSIYIYAEDVATGKAITLMPCMMCSRMIINAQIKEIFVNCDDNTIGTVTPLVAYKLSHLNMWDEV